MIKDNNKLLIAMKGITEYEGCKVSGLCNQKVHCNNKIHKCQKRGGRVQKEPKVHWMHGDEKNTMVKSIEHIKASRKNISR